jgi:glycosyltransferase involved in cell wall biosynthesis
LNSRPRLNVVLCAFACSPIRGSEEGVGWNIASRLGKYHDVTVLYGDCGRNPQRKTEVENWVAKNGPIEGVTFHYVEPTKKGILLLEVAHHGKKICPPLVFIFYYSYREWLKKAKRVALELQEGKTPFDIAHHLTYISYREPGYLWQLPEPTAFVWGPTSGTVNVPWSYFERKILSIPGMVKLAFRNLANLLQHRAVRLKQAAAKASVVWVVGKEDLRVAKECWNTNAVLMPETGTSKWQSGGRPENPKLQLVWSGQHDPLKALPLLLHALVGQENLGVTILGEGPETARWKKMAVDLGVASLLVWTGNLPHSEAQKTMAQADALVFTSLKEATSTVVMEALSQGIPVICHDACGMGEVIDTTCGIKVPMKTPEGSIEGFREAIVQLKENPEELRGLSEGAKAKAGKLSWDHKAKEIADTYSRIAS